MIRAVLFDLDDTLFPQHDWLQGAWEAVAGAAPDTVDRAALLAALREIAGEGSDRGRIIDRALERLGVEGLDVAPLVAAFRAHAPAQLTPYPGVREVLRELASLVPLGLVTDGDVGIQRAKLSALRLDGVFAVIAFSDALGREHRKPSPEPFLAALRELRTEPHHAVFVGDRPDKDVAGAVGVGMRVIRVLTGEYAAVPSPVAPWHTCPDVPAAMQLLRSALDEA